MPRFSFFSLRFRLLLLVLLAVVPALGLTLYTNVELRRAAGADVKEEALRLARIAASDQEDMVKDTRQLLFALAQLSEVRSTDPTACSALFELLNQYPQYALLGVIAQDGDLFCSTLPTDGPVKLADRDYFQRVLQTRDFAIGDYQKDPIGGKATLDLGYPVLDEAGRVQAVVFASLDLTWLNQLAAEAQLPEGSTFTVIDRNGTILVRYPDPGIWVGQSVPEAPVVETILTQRGEGTAEAYGVDGITRLFAFTPLSSAPEDGDVYVSIGIPTAVAFADANRVLMRHLVGLGLVTTLALAAAWYGGDLFILRRINMLLSATKRLSASDLSARTGLSYGKEELSQLAHAFDEMAESLEQAHQMLEQRVADRTRELSALYDVMAVASASLDLETVLESSLDQVLAVMGSEVGAIHLLDEARGMLRLAVWRGVPPDLVAKIELVPVDSGLAGWVIEHGEPLAVSNIATGLRPLLALPATGSQAYVGAPIRTKGRVLGVLSVVGETGRQFKAEEVTLLASIADEVGVAVENARLYQQAEQLAVMKERERLARELHDSVTQSLYSLTLFAEAGRDLARDGELERVESYLTRLGEIAQQALKEMRLLVYQLRPLALQREGLVGALQQRLDAVEGRIGVKARLLTEGLVELPAPVEEGLYRIAQEALNNALKHAAATSVTVYIRTEDERVELEVVDDGQGFDPDAVSDRGGMGLASMRQRAEKLGGSLTVLSAPGEGTRVKVSVGVSTPARSYDLLEVSR
jgi:signal transduction histidine kinase